MTFHYQHQHNYEPLQLHVCCVCMFEKGHVYLISPNPSRRVHKNHMETASVIANTFLTSGLLGGGALSFAVVAIIKHGKWSLTRFARDVSHFRKLSLVTYEVPSLRAYMRELDQWLCVTIHYYLLEYILIACLFSLCVQFALRIFTTELWSCCMLLCPNLDVVQFELQLGILWGYGITDAGCMKAFWAYPYSRFALCVRILWLCFRKALADGVNICR